MDIKGLRQNGSYILVFPLTANGDPVVDLDAAQFTILDNTKCTTLHYATMDTNIEFSDSQLRVPLESSVTVNLHGLLKFELWVRDSMGRPIPARDGNIEFKPTVTRI